MSIKKNAVWLVSIVSIFCGLTLIFFNKKKIIPSDETEPSSSQSITTEAEREEKFPSLEKRRPLFYPLNNKTAQTSLVYKLNRPELTITDDLELIKNVFKHYRTVFKENPIGSHEDIIKILSGKNIQGIEYIPPLHPALSNGKLHDRWGAPFCFHQISGEIMEVRSAGEDGIHWNQDDITIR